MKRLQKLLLSMSCMLAAVPAWAADDISLRLPWLLNVQSAGYVMAKEKGFYDEAGLNVEIQPGGPNLNSTALVASGANTFGTNDVGQIVLGAANGMDLVMVAACFQRHAGGVIALAWPLPGWVVAMMTCVILLAANYSYGLKLSYHGAGELVVFAACAGTVLIPHGLIERTPSSAAAFCAALVGSWNVQVVVFSNTEDAEGDRATGRKTIAASTSRRGNRVYITSVFLFFWAFTAAALASGVVPVAYAVALAPVWALQAYQLWIGVREERWLCARLLGFRVVRLGVAALLMVHLLGLG